MIAAISGRAPRGARGLKLQMRLLLPMLPARRAPRGARGLKLYKMEKLSTEFWSRSSRSAWIEISNTNVGLMGNTCRAPRGARGLKFAIIKGEGLTLPGRAPRGARGLKSCCRDAGQIQDMSRSSRSAWIEI